MRSLMRWGVLTLTTLALAGASRADLLDHGTTTLDTTTGLEWLDVTETLGVSAYQIIVEGYGGLMAAGWTHATIEQVDELFTDAGIPEPHNGLQTIQGFAGADLLIQLLGASGFSSGPYIQAFSGTLVDPSPPFLRYTPVVITSFGTIGGADLMGASVPSSVQSPTIGNYLVRPAQSGPIEVAIDVRPSSLRNPVNPHSTGLLPVAVLTTDEFDATQDIVPESARFGPAGAAPLRKVFVDVDHDLDLDLVLLFRTLETGIQCGDTLVFLLAEGPAGTALEGQDSIVTVGCGPMSRLPQFQAVHAWGA